MLSTDHFYRGLQETYDCHRRGKHEGQGQGLMKLEYWNTGVCVRAQVHTHRKLFSPICAVRATRYYVNTYLILFSQKCRELGTIFPSCRLGNWGW